MARGGLGSSRSRDSDRARCYRECGATAKRRENQIDGLYERYGEAEDPETGSGLVGPKTGLQALAKSVGIMRFREICGLIDPKPAVRQRLFEDGMAEMIAVPRHIQRKPPFLEHPCLIARRVWHLYYNGSARLQQY